MVSTPFSRTLRSIYTDNLPLLLTGLGSLILLMLGWFGWFFFATIAIYETSQHAQVTQDGAIVADFSEASLAQIRRGQSAIFHPAGDGAAAPAIAAVVVGTERAQQQVQLLPQIEASMFQHLREGVAGRVEIMVDKVSPASLVMQAAGLAPDS